MQWHVININEHTSVRPLIMAPPRLALLTTLRPSLQSIWSRSGTSPCQLTQSLCQLTYERFAAQKTGSCESCTLLLHARPRALLRIVSAGPPARFPRTLRFSAEP